MKTFLVCCGCLILSTATFANDNWPQWRGADWNSVSGERGLPVSFKTENRLWKVELPGPGGASPVVWEDQIFVASVSGKDLVLLCIGVDGKLRWESKLRGKNARARMDNSNSASPSPLTDGKHVWVMLSDGILHCFDMDGDLQWTKNMQEEYGKFEIQFGMTSTPLLDKGTLYFQFIHGKMRERGSSLGKLVALNADDGSEAWVHVRKTNATAENKHAYTTPIIYRHDEQEFIVVHGADFTTGHRLADGSELWRAGGLNPPASYNMFLRFVSSPTCTNGLIVIPSAKSGPVIGLDPSVRGEVAIGDQAIKWKLNRGTPDVASPVISNGLVYLARENGVLICLDAETGEEVYSERLLRDRHRATPVIADGHLYLVGRDGTAVVVAEGREFKLVSEHEFNEDTTASPAISNGRIYVRTNKSLMAFGDDKS